MPELESARRTDDIKNSEDELDYWLLKSYTDNDRLSVRRVLYIKRKFSGFKE